jgi:aminopeptidase N
MTRADASTTFIAGATIILLLAGCAETSQPAPPSQATTSTVAFASEAAMDLAATQDGLGDSLAPTLGNGGYDVDHYDLILDWDPTTTTLEADVTITATATTDLDEFNLDFSGFIIDRLTVNDETAELGRQNHELIVTPATPISGGDEFTVSVAYRGTPEPARSELARGRVGWITLPGGEIFVRNDPDGAHTWFPVNDHPSDRARFTLTINVPTPLTVVASGTLERHLERATGRLFEWVTTGEIAPHTLVMVIGDLALVEDVATSTATGVDVRHAVAAGSETLPTELAVVDEAMGFLERRFGRFPADAYGVIVVEGVATMLPGHTWSIVSPDELSGAGFGGRVVRDLTRHWFGDDAGFATWSNVWLSTGVPTYAEWMWLQRTIGKNALEVAAKGGRAKVKNSSWPAPDDPPEGDVYVDGVFLYGATFLHALRLKIGDEAFFETLGTFHDTFAGGHGTTAALVEIAEDTAGESLAFYFDAWFHGDTLPGFPKG